MSLHTSYRLNVIYQAILATTLGISSISAYAVNLSQADIRSTQHEPLSATINVSDIDARHFNANLAPSNVYQQMGLNPNANIQVKFTPTSETTGRIELSSNTPISQPFADVVLSIDNNGEQHVEPQTLLMPVSVSKSAIPADLVTPVMVASENEQNLPIVSDNVPLQGEPLQVQNTAPPLFVEQDEQTDNEQALVATDNQANETRTNLTADTLDDTAAQPLAVDTQKEVIATITPEGTNTQLEVLTETIVRKVYPAGMIPTAQMPVLKETPLIVNRMPQDTDTQTDADEVSDIDIQDSSTASYLVQSGDNLWSIANQIAKANKMDVADVMKELFSRNPEAFNNGKADQLKTNVSLSIPNYEVVPSQKAIIEAIAVAQNRGKQSDALKAKSTKADKSGKRTRTQNTQAQTRRTTARPLPKPQVTLVTPNQSGQATGSQNRISTPKAGSGAGDNLVATLRNTRLQTADSARKVNSLNENLSSATKKLELQNQKLAELETRLKALKDKK